jgi:hypothetical protein
MTLYTASATLGGGNIAVDPSLHQQVWRPGGAHLRFRSRHLYKVDYTHTGSSYAVQWELGNAGMMPAEAFTHRPHANRANWQSGLGMFIRMADEDNYYAAYAFNDYHGADLTKKNVVGEGEGFYVDKVVNGVTTNLYHFKQALPYDQDGETPSICTLYANGSTLGFVCDKYSIDWSTTDTSLTAVGSAGIFFMDWNMISPLNFVQET